MAKKANTIRIGATFERTILPTFHIVKRRKDGAVLYSEKRRTPLKAWIQPALLAFQNAGIGTPAFLEAEGIDTEHERGKPDRLIGKLFAQRDKQMVVVGLKRGTDSYLCRSTRLGDNDHDFVSERTLRRMVVRYEEFQRSLLRPLEQDSPAVETDEDLEKLPLFICTLTDRGAKVPIQNFTGCKIDCDKHGPGVVERKLVGADWLVKFGGGKAIVSTNWIRNNVVGTIPAKSPILSSVFETMPAADAQRVVDDYNAKTSPRVPDKVKGLSQDLHNAVVMLAAAKNESSVRLATHAVRQISIEMAKVCGHTYGTNVDQYPGVPS